MALHVFVIKETELEDLTRSSSRVREILELD
jgi:hypothetical protein